MPCPAGCLSQPSSDFWLREGAMMWILPKKRDTKQSSNDKSSSNSTAGKVRAERSGPGGPGDQSRQGTHRSEAALSTRRAHGCPWTCGAWQEPCCPGRWYGGNAELRLPTAGGSWGRAPGWRGGEGAPSSPCSTRPGLIPSRNYQRGFLVVFLLQHIIPIGISSS